MIVRRVNTPPWLVCRVDRRVAVVGFEYQRGQGGAVEAAALAVHGVGAGGVPASRLGAFLLLGLD